LAKKKGFGSSDFGPRTATTPTTSTTTHVREKDDDKDEKRGGEEKDTTTNEQEGKKDQIKDNSFMKMSDPELNRDTRLTGKRLLGNQDSDRNLTTGSHDDNNESDHNKRSRK